MINQKLWEYQGHLDWSIHKKKSPHLSEKTGSKRMIRPAFVFPAGAAEWKPKTDESDLFFTKNTKILGEISQESGFWADYFAQYGYLGL